VGGRVAAISAGQAGRQAGRQPVGRWTSGTVRLHEPPKHVMIATARKYGVLQFFIDFSNSLHTFVAGLFNVCVKR